MRWSMRVTAAVSAVVLAAGCGNGASGGDALTLYNAQHEDLMKAMVEGFTKETGIKVNLRSGKDFELANQIVQEGDASPADVFVTENSPAMSLVDAKGRFAKVDDATLAQVPGQYSPSSGNWVGFAARSTVFAYNSKQLTAEQLPKSIVDVAQPQWQGKIGVAAAGADFQAIVSAVLEVTGEDATKQWLAGLKRNAKIYPGNIAVMKAVNSGEIQGGVIYHYYWYKDRAEASANSKDTELKFFTDGDPGAFVSVSGAGVVKASKKQADAQKLVKYLTSKGGQQILSDSKALEYAIAKDATPNSKLKPLNELKPPPIDVAKLNGPKVVELMQQAGLI
ncbi:iron ABC transporter substrate-binding protein [Lentzea sp. NBRC 105346]|uniref:iron ABC transporter substrate-binding protein n=1 Tax=Lentzea sp. NBRC 105346 TaxID=3032205 RepID=UPI0024A0EF78|nr:iron ABC transporter substrate-binding protein [Lentzea sp. NBRC 105346]GLZ28549.1 iron ABC transporter substrate-binding protein [Lentzea sp. NBRC 105346]